MTENSQSKNADVEQAISDCLARLKLNNLTIERPTISFDQRGAIAGSAHLLRHHIKLNQKLLDKHPRFFEQEVIPHEVAHLVVAQHHKQIAEQLITKSKLDTQRKGMMPSWFKKVTLGNTTTRPRPHGQEWQFVMRDIFGLPAHSKHQLPLTDAGVKTFKYKCDCSDHGLTIRRHNKIARKQAVYRCKKCNAELIFNRSDTSE